MGAISITFVLNQKKKKILYITKQIVLKNIGTVFIHL